MKKNIKMYKQNLVLIRKETKYWRAILTLIFYIVRYLSERKLAFCCESDTLFT